MMEGERVRERECWDGVGETSHNTWNWQAGKLASGMGAWNASMPEAAKPFAHFQAKWQDSEWVISAEMKDEQTGTDGTRCFGRG